MKLQLSEILEISPALAALNSAKLPVLAGFRIVKAISLIEPELKAYDAQRLRLAAELGELSENNSAYDFPNPDNARLFAEQMTVLLAEVVDIELPKIQLSDLGGDLNIEPHLLRPLVDVLLFEA